MSEDKYKRYSNIRINFRIWMSSENGESIMDDERWNLLIAIRDKGSLRAAADASGVSYRKAWGDLREAESFLGFPVTEKKRGGREGGTSRLNDEGIKLVEAYRAFQNDFHTAANESIIRFKKKLKSDEKAP